MMERETLHFDFSHFQTAQPLTLNVAGRQIPLTAHDESTRKKARAAVPMLALIPDQHLTHHVEVDLPSDAVALTYVTTPRSENGVTFDAPLHLSVHVPRASREKARYGMNGGGVHPKLRQYGVTPESFAATVGAGDDPKIPDHIDTMRNAFDAAVATLFHHPQLINIAHQHAAVILEHITDALARSGDMQAAIFSLGDQWLTTTNVNPAVNPPWLHSKPDPSVVQAAQGALAQALVFVQNDPRLKGQQWRQRYGVTESAYHSSSSQPATPRKMAAFTTATAVDGDKWVAKSIGSTWGLDVDSENISFEQTSPGAGTLSFYCNNTKLRHLSAHVEYRDASGKVLEPPADFPPSKLPDDLRPLFEPEKTKRFVEIIPPSKVVFGVPAGSDWTKVSVPVWPEVHTVRMLWGGLGQGTYDRAVCAIGITATAVLDMAMPAFMLAAGGGMTDTSFVKNVLKDKNVLYQILLAGDSLVSSHGSAAISVAHNPGSALGNLSSKMAPLFLRPDGPLGRYVLANIAAWAALRCVPFIGIALWIVNAAAASSQLAQTIDAVLQSPFVYETDFSRSFDLAVELVPDHRSNLFPEYHDELEVKVVYDGEATLPIYRRAMDARPKSLPIIVRFKSIPAGGKLRVFATFRAANGWASGQGSSAWVEAHQDEGHERTISHLEITTNEIPLNKTSVYQHRSITGVNGSGNVDWIDAKGQPPQTTSTTMSRKLLKLCDLTLAQLPEMAGACWQAVGENLPPDDPASPPTNEALFVVQNVSVAEEPWKALAHAPAGFRVQPGIQYALTSTNDGEGLNFYIDSSNPKSAANNPAGGFHIRHVPLNSTNAQQAAFPMRNDESYGRFSIPMDRFALHPSGVMFAISNGSDKIFRVALSPIPLPDSYAPTEAQGAGTGQRDGLLSRPAGIAVAHDGRILVLEEGNHRVQAFDATLNPVKCFAVPGSTEKLPTMALATPPGTKMLDIAVEQAGYIYVLSEANGGETPNDYRLDLYDPSGKFLVSTFGVTAACITVDLFRTLYTLNYDSFVANGLLQPSISMWLPPPPPPS
jgi:NHL repeat-containing protein